MCMQAFFTSGWEMQKLYRNCCSSLPGTSKTRYGAVYRPATADLNHHHHGVRRSMVHQPCLPGRRLANTWFSSLYEIDTAAGSAAPVAKETLRGVGQRRQQARTALSAGCDKSHCCYCCCCCLPVQPKCSIESVEFTQGCDRFSTLDVSRTGRLPIPNKVFSERFFRKDVVESLPKTKRSILAPLPLSRKRSHSAEKRPTAPRCQLNAFHG